MTSVHCKFHLWVAFGLLLLATCGRPADPEGQQSKHGVRPLNLPCPTRWPFCTLIGADSDQIVRREGVVSQLSQDGTCEVTICLGYGAPETCPWFMGTWGWEEGALLVRLDAYEDRFCEYPASGEKAINRRAISPPLSVTYVWSKEGGHWTSKTADKEIAWANGLKWVCDAR